MTHKIKRNRAIGFAVLAACFYAISLPLSKILLGSMPPTELAAYLYLGAGLGMTLVYFISRKKETDREVKFIWKKDIFYLIGMVLLDIAAPILLLKGMSSTTAAGVSLLNNFEIVATAIIAFLIFKETISVRLWGGIFLVTLSSIILSVQDLGSLKFSTGSLFVLLACICWGFENNCTRMLSGKNPIKIVIVKGLASGSGSLLISRMLGEPSSRIPLIIGTLLVGFFSYGLSVFFYVYAQRELGAAKTSAYYAISPFIGVLLSLIIFKEIPSVTFLIALSIMIAGVFSITFGQKNHEIQKAHEVYKEHE